MRRVAIVGSTQTIHERRKPDQNVEDMIYETVTALLNQTGLTMSDVDMVIMTERASSEQQAASRRAATRARLHG